MRLCHVLSHIFTRPKEFVAYLLNVATTHHVPVLNVKRMGAVLAHALGVRRVAAFAIVRPELSRIRIRIRIHIHMHMHITIT